MNKGGHGQPGYCMLCALNDPIMQDELDRRAGLKDENGRNAYSWKKLNEWMESKGMKTVARGTIDKHRKHVEHPRDRVVNAIAKRTMEHGVQPAQASHEEFLASLVSIGQQRISENPEEVTIDQALKAAQIQAQREKKGSTHNILVQLFTSGPDEATIIEGEATEV